MINLQTVTYTYQLFEMNDVTFIRLAHNIANALTNVYRQSPPMDTFNSKKLFHPAKRWKIPVH